MSAIFFDLETSQKDFIGQILNFAFVQIDDQWQEISKFCGEIQISPLELPHPGAILANRIDVIDHQKRAKLSEAPAMREIAQYLTEAAASSKKPIPLIGYNSTRFDIPFLRTSMIRNGVNPYIRNIENKDLLHLVRYLSVSNPHFPRECAGDDSRLSLRLETITHAFKLLAGAQTHNSLDDVYLTIKLAQYLAEKFHGDIRHFHAYQAPTGLKKFDAVMTLHPNYDLNAESNFRALPYVFLDEDRGGSLWVDVEAI
ncbi:MAG: hypothetical protein KDD62_09375, partial [Bdellovibrionales bacterium]|nr:hypothetical protein [Bdellovibrionales bacterium]